MPRNTAHVRVSESIGKNNAKNSNNNNVVSGNSHNHHTLPKHFRRPSFNEDLIKNSLRRFSTFSRSSKITTLRRNSTQFSNAVMATIDKMPKLPRRMKAEFESSSDDAMNECDKHPLGTDQSCCKQNVMVNSKFDYSHDQTRNEYCREFDDDEDEEEEEDNSDFCTVTHENGKYQQHLLKHYLNDCNWPNSMNSSVNERHDGKFLQHCRKNSKKGLVSLSLFFLNEPRKL